MDTHDLSLRAWFHVLVTYANYFTLICIGYFQEYCSKLIYKKGPPAGYAPLLKDFEDFFTRRIYARIQDAWNVPIASNPGAWIDIMERKRGPDNHFSNFVLTGTQKRCLNLSSYNYLGFADNSDFCTQHVLKTIDEMGVANSSSRAEFGRHNLIVELEATMARFIGKEDSIVCSMGFATNSTMIPLLCGEGSLIISDSLNHSSIITGARGSGAKIKVFKHNDPASLEKVVVESIVERQPRTRLPWKKIIILVEGIYSMEGEYCPLQEIVKIKNKYKCYLYVDEAHSIGALGKTGRGICEHSAVSPDEVDVLMGTFTKSFGSCGGYIAGSKKMINYLRINSWHALYGCTMAPPSAQQIISALQLTMGEDGSDLGKQKLQKLRDNSNFFRNELKRRGFSVVGAEDSPVIPVMLYNPAKLIGFSRECLARNLAVVVVGFPATSLVASRARFCISAGHSIEDLREAARVIDEVGEIMMCKYEYGSPACAEAELAITKFNSASSVDTAKRSNMKNTSATKQ